MRRHEWLRRKRLKKKRLMEEPPNKPSDKDMGNTLVKILIDWIIEKLVSKIGFLSWGPFPALISMILTPYLKKLLSRGLDEAIGFYMSIKINGQVEDVNKVTARIKAAMEQGGYSARQIEKLDNDLASASRKLIRFDS